MAAQHTSGKRPATRPTHLAVGVGVLTLMGASLGNVALELLTEAARSTTTNTLG